MSVIVYTRGLRLFAYGKEASTATVSRLISHRRLDHPVALLIKMSAELSRDATSTHNSPTRVLSKVQSPKKASCWSSNYFPSGGSATVFSIDSEVDHGMELPRMDAYPSSLDSPYSSRSSSPPSSMSPDTSGEEDLLSREDTLQRNNGLAFGVHWTQAEQRRAFAKKSSGLSGTAPVFAPRTVYNNNNNANNHHHHHHHQPHSSHPHWHHSSRLGAERPLQQARA
eukprot:scpid39832/ scgid10892/ 